MTAYRTTLKLANNLDGIHEYTITILGLERMWEYLNGLRRRCGNLAERPALGRRADRLVPELRRCPYRSHVVFYMLGNRHKPRWTEMECEAERRESAIRPRSTGARRNAGPRPRTTRMPTLTSALLSSSSTAPPSAPMAEPKSRSLSRT